MPLQGGPWSCNQSQLQIKCSDACDGCQQDVCSCGQSGYWQDPADPDKCKVAEARALNSNTHQYQIKLLRVSRCICIWSADTHRLHSPGEAEASRAVICMLFQASPFSPFLVCIVLILIAYLSVHILETCSSCSYQISCLTC